MLFLFPKEVVIFHRSGLLLPDRLKLIRSRTSTKPIPVPGMRSKNPYPESSTVITKASPITSEESLIQEFFSEAFPAYL